MKMDLVTSIAVTVVGILMGFFVTNLVVAPLDDFSFPAVDVKPEEASAYATLTSPDSNVFNYRALNPTVEVFVGECEEYGTDGKCLEDDEGANKDEDEDEDNEDDDENENIDDIEDIDINLDEDFEVDASDGSSTTNRSPLDEYRDALRYTPNTTRTDEQENN